MLVLLLAGGLLSVQNAFAAYPATWPLDSDWIAYTIGGVDIEDPINSGSNSDPSNGGAAVSPTAIDVYNGDSGQYASVYYYYDSSEDVVFFRLRLQNTPEKDVADLKQYTWNVLMDLDGDGWKESFVELNGNQPDNLTIYYGDTDQQNISSASCATDNDGIVAQYTGATTITFDQLYRVVDDTGNNGGYLLDIQVNRTDLKDCAGNVVLSPEQPFQMAYSTSATAQNPTQKDFVNDGTPFTMDANRRLPYQDPLTLSGSQVDPVVAVMNGVCNGSDLDLSVNAMDTLTNTNTTTVVDTLDTVAYYYRLVGDDNPNISLGNATAPTAPALQTWDYSWDLSAVADGDYIVWAVITDDDGKTGESTREVDFQLVTVASGVCSSTSTNPVTIAYMNATRRGKLLVMDWSTATETSNIGFNVYAVISDEWIRLNDALIPGSLDSLEPQHYETLLSNPYGPTLTEIGIAGVDVNGHEDRHGPYPVDRARGARPQAERVDWKQVRKDMKANMSVRAASKTPRLDTVKQGDAVHVDVPVDGLYRISDAELRAAGFRMPRVSADEVAISFRGNPVARHVGGLNKRGKWSKDSWVEFIGEAPTGRDAVYLNANRYQLTRDSRLAENAPAFDIPGPGPAVIEDNNKYAFTTPAADPWYDAAFYAMGPGRPGYLDRSFDLPGLQPGDAQIEVHLAALSADNHHVEVYLNGALVADETTTSGWHSWSFTITDIEDDLLETGNELSLVLPGDTSAFDYVLFDRIEVTYANDLAGEVYSPVLERAEKVTPSDLATGVVDVLVISHPALIGGVLDQYIDQLGSKGWKAEVVDVLDIYQAYGYGMATPTAIVDFLQDAKSTGYTHVQLVGAASYDYRDFLELGSVSFIPSEYVLTSDIINYTPCDTCLVLDDQDLPTAAIGRWPVRSEAELQAVINKGDAWAASQGSESSALLIADSNDAYNDFTGQLEKTAEHLVEAGGWSEPARIYLDDAIAAATGDVAVALENARGDIITELEGGRSVTIFSGHGAPSMWSFKGLLEQQHIAGIHNEAHPTLALPLTCYTTYADSPYTSSLAHQFMAAGEHGTVAIYGAATLGNYNDNGVMVKEVLDGLLANKTLGESVLDAKRNLGPAYRNVILNTNLLGDVTLRLQ